MEANEQPSCWLETGQQAMEIEAQAIARAALRLDGNFSRAVELILGHPGKLVVTGLGKSGHVARKIVATLCSTGTPAVFLHASHNLWMQSIFTPLTTDNEYTKWVAGDLGLALVVVATIVAAVFWLKRRELPDYRQQPSAQPVSA